MNLLENSDVSFLKNPDNNFIIITLDSSFLI